MAITAATVTAFPPSSAAHLGKVAEIAALVSGEVVGDGSPEIIGVAGVEDAEPGDLVFADSLQFLERALQSHATAVLTSEALTGGARTFAKPLILVDDPRVAFVDVMESCAQAPPAPPGIDPAAQVGSGCLFGPGVSIAAGVTVDDGVTLGTGVTLFAGVRIGAGCVLGDDTVVYPNAVLYPGVRVGRRCRLHAGCVLGCDGFGYLQVGYTLRKIPQFGRVIVEDDVEIGANACVDRAKTGATVIGAGTKIDNLVHIGHNVRIGSSCILVAQAGVAGSVTLGSGVVLGGQAGIKDHVTLGDGVRVGAQGGVIGDVPAGVSVSGYPARPHATKMREYAALAALPEYMRRIRALERRGAERSSRRKP